jgi:hypothetical protein
VINRKSIAVTILLLLSAFIIYASLFKTVHHKEIKINGAVSVIHREISSLNKIAKWFLPFAAADTNSNKIVKQESLEYENSSLKISSIIGYSAQYEVTENKNSASILFSVMPDTAHYSKVTASYKSTLWQEIFSSGKIIQQTEKSLETLKDYISDAKKMYGYDVEMTSVTDTAFLFSSKVVSNPEKKAAFKNLYESLIKFAEIKNLGYNGVRIFYMLPLGKDSIHLFTGIGITNTNDAPFTGALLLKKMPYMGKLLMSYYQGSFANSITPLNALAQYETDNNMKSMAIPFIKLITEGIEFDDSQIIQAKALYPVY